MEDIQLVTKLSNHRIVSINAVPALALYKDVVMVADFLLQLFYAVRITPGHFALSATTCCSAWEVMLCCRGSQARLREMCMIVVEEDLWWNLTVRTSPW